MLAAAVETIGVFPDLHKGLSDLLIEMLCIGRVRVLVLKDESQLLTGKVDYTVGPALAGTYLLACGYSCSVEMNVNQSRHHGLAVHRIVLVGDSREDIIEIGFDFLRLETLEHRNGLLAVVLSVEISPIEEAAAYQIGKGNAELPVGTVEGNPSVGVKRFPERQIARLEKERIGTGLGISE